ncbi:MAG: hypothetical protein JNJ76_07310 [Candidatus Competibacter sp.]|nr:hypothetical protein [Candidatus Competibacter sp.]
MTDDSRLPPLLLTVAAGGVLACHALWGWVPILDSANLVFHEAGHPVFGMLSARLSVYGGTLMQLLMPAACAWEFYRREQRWGFYLCLLWVAENLLNIARYMADARAHLLPLVGGIDPEDFHDWTEIFNRWGALRHDTALASLVRIGAVALMAWTLKRAWTAYTDDHE